MNVKSGTIRNEKDINSEAIKLEEKFHLTTSWIYRSLYLTAGTVSLILGILGIFLPVLPTTPFLLLTAACYAKGSKRCYDWLMNNKHLGAYIRNWREKGVIPYRTKAYVLCLIGFSFTSTILFFVPFLLGQVVMGIIGITTTFYIYRMPTLD